MHLRERVLVVLYQKKLLYLTLKPWSHSQIDSHPEDSDENFGRDEVLAAAKTLVEKGPSVLVTLGERGAMLVTTVLWQ